MATSHGDPTMIELVESLGGRWDWELTPGGRGLLCIGRTALHPGGRRFKGCLRADYRPAPGIDQFIFRHGEHWHRGRMLSYIKDRQEFDRFIRDYLTLDQPTQLG